MICNTGTLWSEGYVKVLIWLANIVTVAPVFHVLASLNTVSQLTSLDELNNLPALKTLIVTGNSISKRGESFV